jgi:hypothetical protein
VRNELLEEQWVSLGRRKQTAASFVVEHGIGQQEIDELVRLHVGEWAKHEVLCGGGEVGPLLAEHFACDAHEQDRRVAGRGDQMLDEVEERRFRPVQIVESQHERPP